MNRITIGTGGLTLDDVAKALGGAEAVLSEAAVSAMEQSRCAVERALSAGIPTYGINTGFGRLASTLVEGDSLMELQRNLLLSHACGTGPPIPHRIARIALLLRAASLAQGRSGAGTTLVGHLLSFYNGGIVPLIPSKGSLGASGDLAPLAHMSLPLLGEGSCLDGEGRIIPGAEALARLGLEPVVLGAKEGLALINGTPVLTAGAACALLDALILADAADVASAMTAEVLLATPMAFDACLISLRPHPGAVRTAANLRALLSGSGIVESHSGCPRVQDAYSLRCVPQVHGATRDALDYVSSVISVELASATDNPLMCDDGMFHSCGNFHGQPVALAADHLCLAASELGSISERRIERLLNPDLSGLPAFLAARPGLDSGLMIAQYTAAALAGENKILCHPASADSIPVSGAQEDHVSMGATAARKALDVVVNVRRILATEIYCAAQAYEYLDRSGRGRGTGPAYDAVRAVAPSLGTDRRFDSFITSIEQLIGEGVFSWIVGDAVGGDRSGAV